MTAHLLFEQSGTFKNAFIKNGVNAIDYDILNDFGEDGRIYAFSGGMSAWGISAGNVDRRKHARLATQEENEEVRKEWERNTSQE